jgi:hypothetical protein
MVQSQVSGKYLFYSKRQNIKLFVKHESALIFSIELVFIVLFYAALRILEQLIFNQLVSVI